MSATVLEIVGGAVYWGVLLTWLMLLVSLPVLTLYGILFLLAKLARRIRRGPPADANRE